MLLVPDLTGGGAGASTTRWVRDIFFGGHVGIAPGLAQ
jgi:hypothetical protein